MSKLTAPIGSTFVISYATSIGTNSALFTVFLILHIEHITHKWG